MADERHPKPGSDGSTEPGGLPDPHDDREVEVYALMRLGAILVAVTIGTMGIVWVFTSMLVREENARHTPPPPIARTRTETPLEPRLQPRPTEGLAELRAHEEEVLGSYRWVDPARGVVGVPVERALELLLEQPLPSRDPSSVPPEPPSSRPTQSSLGEQKGEAP